jgi:hypothetical protein
VWKLHNPQDCEEVVTVELTEKECKDLIEALNHIIFKLKIEDPRIVDFWEIRKKLEKNQ